VSLSSADSLGISIAQEATDLEVDGEAQTGILFTIGAPALMGEYRRQSPVEVLSENDAPPLLWRDFRENDPATFVVREYQSHNLCVAVPYFSSESSCFKVYWIRIEDSEGEFNVDSDRNGPGTLMGTCGFVRSSSASAN
jgi:hypothetical protein